MPEIVTLTPLENALDSVRLMQKGARSASVSGAKETLVWGWHAVRILATVRLAEKKDIFDPWIQQYFEDGEPEVEARRDVHWDLRTGLSFLEILDLMSETDLPLIKPDFYQGWQDRTSRSRVLRGQVRSILGTSLGEEKRDGLLYLLAVYYRLIRLPAAVAISMGDIRQNMPQLCDLIEMLIPDDKGEWGIVLESLKTVRNLLEDPGT